MYLVVVVALCVLAQATCGCTFVSQGSYVAENIERRYEGPLMMNAFEMITLSQGLNLSALFDRRQVRVLIDSYLLTFAYWLLAVYPLRCGFGRIL